MTPESAASDWQLYKRLLSYVVPMWPVFCLAVIGFFVGNAGEVYFARLVADIIEVWDNPPDNAAIYFPVVILITAALRGMGGVVGELMLGRISFHVVHEIRVELFAQLLKLPNTYFDRNAQGRLVSRLTFNVAQLRDTASDALKTIIQDGSKVLWLLAAMLYTSWKLTLIFLTVTPLVALIATYASKRFRRISERIQGSMGDVTHVASELVGGYRATRIFGGEAYEQARFHHASERNRRQNLKMILTKATSVQIIQLFVAAALALLIALLFNPAIGGSLSEGDMLFFIGLAGLLAKPIKKLSEVNAKLQRGLAAAEDVFAQFDEAVEQDLGHLSAANATGRVEFRDVHFAYDPAEESVLRGISFTVEPGQTVALVGRSGGGKSTLVNLIPRFYNATKGEVLLDGIAVQDYSLRSLRSQIAIVNQQVVLFNDTLLRNVAYGELADKTAEEVSAALVKAHADEFVARLPDGLQTQVGDDGLLLSGGQRQRVAIARALLKDAPLLILDEATSALDNTAERHIQAALEAVMRNRTTFVIAHRLSTIEKADQILVIEDGRVVESGNHTELLARDGAYASLYNSELAVAPATSTES